MRRAIFGLSGVLVAFALFTVMGSAGFATSDNGYAPGEVVVKFKSATTDSQILSANQLRHGQVVDSIYGTKTKLIRATDGQSMLSLLLKYSSDPNVEYAEPNWLASASFVPNDTHWSYQYGLRKISIVPAWDITQGLPSVKIAIVDSGVDDSHPDLNGICLSGYDFVNEDSDPFDDYGHGTHVAGIASARINNGIGIAGVAPGCKILPVKVLDSNGSGYDLQIAKGIRWAADQGARVINLSLGFAPGVAPSGVEDAINYAWARGSVIVAAAGNRGEAGPGIDYPAAFPHVISVAATDAADNKTAFSSYGPGLDVAAPGNGIYSTLPGNSYGWNSGTSMATPHVSGLAALILSAKPTLANDQVELEIERFADDLGTPGRDDYYGFGRINAYMSLRLFDATKVQMTSGDYNGDGKTDNAALYEYGNDSRIWTFISDPDGAGTVSSVNMAWLGTGFVATKAKITSGDYNGDGKDDIAALYEYGNDSRIWTFISDPDGAGTVSSVNMAWLGTGFVATKAKITSGDYNADGKDDIAALYDYGSSTSRIWTFISDPDGAGTVSSVNMAWYSGLNGFDANKASVTSGDYDNDGDSDAAMLYDYGPTLSRIWLFKSNGPIMVPSLAWTGQGFNAAKAKITSGYYNNDSLEDFATLYDYTSSTSRIWTFISNGSTMSATEAWYSGIGNFDATKAKITSGDFDGDGLSDIGSLYDYGTAHSRIWMFESNGTTMSPLIVW